MLSFPKYPDTFLDQKVIFQLFRKFSVSWKVEVSFSYKKTCSLIGQNLHVSLFIDSDGIYYRYSGQFKITTRGD